MTDGNRKEAQSTPTKTSKSATPDQSLDGRDDGIGQNPDPDSQKSSTARPRGHTEDPDRTL